MPESKEKTKKHFNNKRKNQEPSVATQVCRCSIWEADVGGSGVQGHAQPPRELDISLDFTPCLRKYQIKTNNQIRTEQKKSCQSVIRIPGRKHRFSHLSRYANQRQEQW